MNESEHPTRRTSSDVVGMYRQTLSDVIEVVGEWQGRPDPLEVPAEATPVAPLFAGMVDCLFSTADLVDRRPVPALIVARSLFEKAVRIGRYAATTNRRYWELLSSDLRVQALGDQEKWARDRLEGARVMRITERDVSDSDVAACEAEWSEVRDQLRGAVEAVHELASVGGRPAEARWKDFAQMARAQNRHLHMSYLRATAAAHGSLLANQGRVVPRLDGGFGLRVAGEDSDHALLACHLSAGGFILGEAMLSRLCGAGEIVTGISTLRPLVSLTTDA